MDGDSSGDRIGLGILDIDRDRLESLAGDKNY